MDITYNFHDLNNYKEFKGLPTMGHKLNWLQDKLKNDYGFIFNPKYQHLIVALIAMDYFYEGEGNFWYIVHHMNQSGYVLDDLNPSGDLQPINFDSIRQLTGVKLK